MLFSGLVEHGPRPGFAFHHFPPDNERAFDAMEKEGRRAGLHVRDMKGSVPEFGLFSISRICFVKTGSAFRDPFTHGRYAFIPALNHPRSVKYKRARQKANSYQYYENVLTD